MCAWCPLGLDKVQLTAGIFDLPNAGFWPSLSSKSQPGKALGSFRPSRCLKRRKSRIFGLTKMKFKTNSVSRPNVYNHAVCWLACLPDLLSKHEQTNHCRFAEMMYPEILRIHPCFLSFNKLALEAMFIEFVGIRRGASGTVGFSVLYLHQL